MASAEQLNHAKAFLRKAEEYLASAGDKLIAERPTAAVGDPNHAAPRMRSLCSDRCDRTK